MPINPNIALGAQLPAPVNLLGQMGQMLALKAAAQDTEGYEGVKGAITGGMSPTDPRMLQFGKRGIDAYKAAGEGSVKQQDALSKAYTNSRQALSLVRSPEDLLTYSISQFSDPLIGPSLKASGLTPESVAANLQKELATSGFENVLKKSAMGLDGWFKDQTSRRNTDVSSGASYQQAALAREKFEYDKANPQLSMAQGDTGFYLYNPRDPNSARPLGMAPQAPVAAPAQLPPVANNLMLTQPTAPAANALVAPPANQPGAPTVANANALANQPTLIRPKQPIRQPVAVMKDGKAVLVPPDQAVGMTPATAFAEKTAEDKAKINRDLNTAIRNLEAVVKPGGLLEKSTGSGLGRMVDASAGFFGEATPGAVAGAQLAPIADMVLKMVPRFEGPQSNKDVDSYLAAAGKLADTGLPNEIRKGAAKTILKLMQERKGQFEIKDQGGAGGGAPADPLGIR
jgi:hypothetical protein